MTLRETLGFGEKYLRDRDIADAGCDAWLLLQTVTDTDRTHFLLEREREMPEEQLHEYMRLLGQRGEHIPLQHLTGEQEFMGFSFRVNEHVLIPRQDTEILAEEALKLLRAQMRVLDLCTGSGCLAVTLARLRKSASPGRGAGGSPPRESAPVDAADISAEALAVAGDNVRRLGANVRLLQSDLFADITDVYDMIVSNPPYIPTAEIDRLSPEVCLHEPRTALDGHEDGLYFYREIIRGSQTHLFEGGWLLFETGFDQADRVSALMEDAGYTDIRTVKDLAGLDRVVLGRRKMKEDIHV